MISAWHPRLSSRVESGSDQPKSLKSLRSDRISVAEALKIGLRLNFGACFLVLRILVGNNPFFDL